MKKIRISVIALLTIVTALVLVACGGGDKKAVATAKENLQIQFTGTETATTVKNKLTLPEKEGEVLVEWASSNSSVVTATGTVNRQPADTDITLTATLTLGKATDTKEFAIKVLKKAEKGSDLITEHYAETLSKPGYVVTKNLDLIDSIGEYTVNWSIVGESKFLNAKGELLGTPTYTQGDQSASLRATMSDGTSKTFILSIKAAAQTTEEKITEALDFVTIKPSGEFQTVDFVASATYNIDGTEVPVTWVTSNADVMTADGKLQIFESDEPKSVTLAASITYDGVTLSKEVTFLVKPTTIFTSMDDAFAASKAGSQVFIKNVTSWKNISGGYYIASSENDVAYVNGNKPSTFKNGKVYDIIAEVDIYNGSYQLKSINFTNERNGAANVIVPRVITLDEFANMPAPSKEKPVNHEALILENVKSYQLATPGNYDTFLVNKDYKGTNVTTKDAILVYYNSDISVLRGIVGKEITSIEVVNSGFRSDHKFWYINFIGTLDDIKLNLTPEESVEAVEGIVKSLVPKNIFENKNLDFPETSGKTTIEWTSDKENIISNTGAVTIPASGQEEVTITAVIKATEDTSVTKTVTMTTIVGEADSVTITEFLALKKGKFGQFKGIVTGNINNNTTWAVQDAAGNSIALRLHKEDKTKLKIGDKIVVTAMRDEFNGLLQAAAQINVTTHEEDITIAFKDLNNEDLTAENTKKYQANLISIDNLYVEAYDEDNFGSITMTLVRLLDGQKISFKWDNRVVVEGSITPTLEVGDVINIVGAPLGWNKGPQINQSSKTQVVKVDALDDTAKAEASLLLLNVNQEVKEAGAIGLVSTGAFGTTIKWTFKDSSNANNALIDLETGLVSLPAEVSTVSVTLVATSTSGTVSKTKEFVISLGVGESVSISKYDFKLWAGSTKKGTQLTTSEAFLAAFNEVTENGIITGVENLSRIYQGNGSGGGSDENSETVLKTGTKSAAATMKLTLSENVKVIVIKGRGWTDNDKVTINGVTVNVKADYTNAADGTGRFGVISIEVPEETKTLEFLFENRMLIEEISFFS